MNKEIEEILKEHKKINPTVELVKVTITRWYEIPKYSLESNPDILKEWFQEFSINRSHAFRDNSVLLQYFNNDEKIEKI